MNKWRLIEAIDQAGYSQRSLAKAIHMDKNTLNNKIHGRSPMTLDDVDKICSELGITSMEQKAHIFLS